MILIASANYTTQEIANELGKIPSAFVPLKNQRLFKFQNDLFAKFNDDVYLSLPKSWKISKNDQDLISKINLKIIYVPDNFTLSESILYCLNQATQPIKKFKLLHGDTLFDSIPNSDDNFFITGDTPFEYKWGEIISSNKTQKKQNKYLAGYFSFSNVNLLKKYLKKEKKDFVTAISNYSNTIDTKLKHKKNWYDFGHLNSYFYSKKKFTTERSFNQLNITKYSVIKSSLEINKIKGESDWYQNLPYKLRVHSPTLLRPIVIRKNVAEYEIEYLSHFTLSEIFLFGNKNKEFWLNIFNLLNEILTEFTQVNETSYSRKNNLKEFDVTNNLYLKKTIVRLNDYEKISKKNVKDLIKMAIFAANKISKVQKKFIAFQHGDLCFSNILYDSRLNKLIMIDPRGIDYNGKSTSFGDIRYDISKIYHSVIGGYDLIISEKYMLKNNKIKFDEPYSSLMEKLDNVFIKNICPKNISFNKNEIIAINVLLFLSMIPLHRESYKRQEAIIANAYYLYNKINKK